MNQILIGLFLILFAAFSSAAQTTASKTAQIGKDSEKKKEEIADAETLATDFKNFSFPDFNSKDQKNFTLKNGVFQNLKAKSGEAVNYRFRKVFYFDVTGDEKTEAIVHIFASACEDCAPQSIFYLYSNEKNQPKEIWKIALGTQEKCGLKDVLFDKKEIVLETFGDCELNGWNIAKNLNSKKTAVSTRFTFDYQNKEFLQTSKAFFPFSENDIQTYRSKLKFGSEN